ncbi:TerC family protein [Cytophagaceae bacterium DM2B3-1]|uniref:TerC family protein n=1 Tax=Xanthocytophaga flava TaxID=3048013 RepID=A0ABT7CCW6_9BACT|nr:TerC family protein [Xanthocytophaga flavus]MDJ1470091.1 TerC family protein [Xanthocytophaga flavus]MDJ1491346.1 TerC family protein [Xanthocytophaga flavus]
MESLFTTQAVISMFTLTLLEIVLGIDNIIFVSIISNKLPQANQAKARNIGLILAVVIRILLLFGLSWIIALQDPWFSLFGREFTGKDLILLVGGFFLIGKSVSEIHGKLEGEEEEQATATKANESNALGWVILQITVINLVFSFDSILTAIGLVKEVPIMIIAVILSSIIMAIFAKAVNDFINRHPTFKILALSFLIMIGFLLAMEAFGFHIDKGYVYFAMAFAVLIEIINMQIRKRTKPVKLRNQELKDY